MDNKKTLSELAKILSRTGELPEEKRREVLNALQTAAREAEIEAALESVRARSMAMHSSDELNDVLKVFFQQFEVLGIKPVTAFLSLFDIESNTFTYRSTSKAGSRMQTQQVVDLDSLDIWQDLAEKWKNDKQDAVEVIYYPKEVLPELFQLFEETFSAMPEKERIRAEDFPDGGYAVQGYCKFGYIGFNHYRPPTEEEKQILIRFAREFGRLYQRFLDVRNAEEQAREAQIEAALERVRARTMAMHRSKELGEVAAVLFEQINSLGTSLERLNIGIVREDEGVFEWWSTEQGGQQIDHLFKGSIEEPTTISKVYAAWKQGKKSLEIDLSGKELQQWIKYLKEEIRMPFKDELIRDRRVHTGAFFKHGGLLVSSPEPLSTESVKLLERFGTVFEQTYTRFLDLQKAEAQARESEIQLALERIRARTMAMQESTELTEVLTVVFQQLKLLGVETVWAHLTLLDLENDRFTYRMTGRNGERIMAEETIALDASEHWAHVAESLKASNPEPVNRFEVPPEGLDALWELFDGIFSKLPEGDQVSPKDFPNGLYATQAYCKFGFLGLNQTRESTPEEADILLRFATEFGRVYQRFLDLQQAEERAREAQIETALERVRARSMAMHQSSELNVILSKVFEELTSLEIEMERAVIWIYHPENRSVHWWAANPEAESGSECYFISDQDDPVYNEYWKAWEERRTKDLYILEGEYKENWTQILFNDTGLKRLPEVVKAAMVRPEKIFLYNTFNDFGVLFIARLEPLPDEKFSILERFGKVFNQCYTRFQDIQKAEAQARESEIQLALERVRARTMAMHHSKELLEVIRVIAEQLEKLDIRYNNVSLGPNILEGGLKFWLAGYNMPEPFIIDVPYIDHPAPNRVRKATKEGISFFADVLTKEENRIFVRHILKHTDPKYYTEEIEEKLLNAPGYARSNFILKNINLYVGNYKAQPYSVEENAIIGRFARVFEQAYTRFLDLEKAEAQAREAEIETALERVRAKTMAMQKTEDIGATVTAFFGELTGLGLDKHLVCGINILSQSERGQIWAATDGHDSDETVYQGFLDMSRHPMLKDIHDCWERGEPYSSHILEGSDIPEYYKVLNAAPDFTVQLDTEDVPEIEYYWCVNFRDGYLFSITHSPLPEEIRSILERFASAFSQTFTRYLDLQKAEAQARESQIEAALERVRSKTMAMHNSQDVGETVTTLFDEVTRLGLDTSIRCGIGILEGYEDEEGGMMETWSAASAEEGSVDLKTGMLTMSIHPLLRGVQKAWKNRDSTFSYELKGPDLTRYYDLLNKEERYPLYTDLDTLQPPHFHNSFYFREGILFSFTRNPLTAEATKILGRFASLFGQTYRRYLDLKNAEKLAREAQIETAMERIRSRALAMRTSDEIMDVITELRRQIDSLGQLDLEASVVHLYTEGAPTFQSIAAVRPPGEAGEIVLANVEFPVDAMDPIRHMIDMYRSEQAEYTIEFTKEMAEQWQQVMLEHAPVIAERRVGFVDNRRLSDRSEYWNFADFTGGSLLLVTHSPASGDTLEVLRKAAYVFDLAYRRHLDLIEAEAREQEAVKQASLDRVRAEISGMRSTSDLERITPLIWKELTTLGVPFFRCGVFIIDEKEQKIHSYLSNPQGESLAVWHSDFSLIPLFGDLVENWKKQEMYLTEWDREEFLNFSGVLMDHGLVDDRKRYQSGKDAPEHLVLQMVPFKQGMLYVGSDTHLEATQMELVRALALAFSVAYARYEDFNQLEQAIGELKATQSQLIQSEKMASLGELTAGIAHEIKNPLNFVNNFSEVSRELLEELMEEIRNGDMEEVEALTGDLLQNLEKITHHGRRADSIVKGMLQHSRSGDGKKEPTDLNALADEYMRLAYHGLRAKDKSFNAAIQTDFDPKAGMLDMIPQDMGRVLLNLLTNAFYAVTEKAQKAGTDYKPTVSIRTARDNGQVTVSVKDNGSGIPEKVREKIFQPFFTTKPTGQGTGLGLSLSYDIVTKGHGGTLQVASEEGKGTEFTIKLPSA
ncbi:sensor histidine kinase [Robiginitalea sp. SC105]|uniref:sensor histidine kinase n=1 Tax=Robiginitalea sp. SC105 TaxID=2762332 RepID=UPI001C8E04E9|nr:ATP-binding protein [Robiginitalea sp. SC105]